MAAQTSSYYLTADDLPEADKKTLAAIQPLLDALNRTLGTLIPQANSVPAIDFITMSVNIDTALASRFPLLFKSQTVPRPQSVTIARIVPADSAHVLTTPFVVQQWGMTGAGFISVGNISGLLVNNSYQITFMVC